MEASIIERVEVFEHLDVRGLLHLHFERLGLFERRLAALDFVDQVRFDFLERLAVDIADDDDDARRADDGALLRRHELDALRGRICRHVVLARQIFHREHARVREMRQLFLIDDIDRRLGKDDRLHLFVFLVGKALDVIPRDDAHGLELRQAECLRQIVTELLCRDVKESLPFFHENSSYHECWVLLLRMSVTRCKWA